MERSEFLCLPIDEVVKIVQQKGQPQAGVFVPDGNRRLVLAMTGLPENSDAFFLQVAKTQTAGFLENLQVFFDHGLPILFAPLFSRSVLLRGNKYRSLTVVETLRTLFTDQAWLDFYQEHEVSVRVYGNLEVLAGEELAPAFDWIHNAEEYTCKYDRHRLYLGIGGEPWVGHDAALAASRFIREFGREPDKEELIFSLYGRALLPANFVIISSKFAGIGALPALICGRNTNIYYLPVPGVMGLTACTYRSILYDLLFLQGERTGDGCYELSPGEQKELYTWYTNHADIVMGVGHTIGSVWIPDISWGGLSYE